MAWLKERNEERLKRASRARNRPLAHFRPGDEVDFWIRGKGRGTRPDIKGKFRGGAVVLPTSTEIDEEDGSRKLRKFIWIIHAGTVIKCPPEHLRYARQVANLGQAQRLPWTHDGLDGCLRKGQYENLPRDATPDEDDTDDEAEGLGDDASTASEHEAREVKRKLEMEPNSSSSLARPRDETVLSRSVEKTHTQDEEPVQKMSKKPAKLKRQDSRAVFLSMDVTSSVSQQKRFVNRPGQFVAIQLKK